MNSVTDEVEQLQQIVVQMREATAQADYELAHKMATLAADYIDRLNRDDRDADLTQMAMSFRMQAAQFASESRKQKQQELAGAVQHMRGGGGGGRAPVSGKGRASSASSGGGGGGEGGASKCPSDFDPMSQDELDEMPSLDELMGMDDEKRLIRNAMLKPLQPRMRELLRSQKAYPSNVLLYGPGGTGKTALIKAVARETGTPLYEAPSDKILGGYVGQTEKCLRKVMESARNDPHPAAIVLFDEADAILAAEGPAASGRIAAFKQIIQRPNDPSLVVTAATNKPWLFKDKALKRRFPVQIYVGLPDAETRMRIIDDLMVKKFNSDPSLMNNAERTYIAEQTEAYTPAELSQILQLAWARNPKSVYNADDPNMRYVSRTSNSGVIIPMLIGVDDADIEVESQREGSLVLTFEQMRAVKGSFDRVEWPGIEGRYIREVLDSDDVKRNNNQEDIKQMLDYAVSVGDQVTAERIKPQVDMFDRILSRIGS